MHDDELTRLLRRSAPDARPRDEHRRQLRSQLEHNFRHHRRRSRRVPTSLAALLAGLSLLALWALPLGSDDFDLIPVAPPAPGARAALRHPLTDQLFLNVTGDEAGAAQAEQRERDPAAGRYRIVGYSELHAGGMGYRRIEVKVDSDAENIWPTHQTGELEAQDRVMDFLKPVQKKFADCLMNDGWTSTETTEKIVDGMRFRVITRSKTFPEVGEVVFVEADRIP